MENFDPTGGYTTGNWCGRKPPPPPIETVLEQFGEHYQYHAQKGHRPTLGELAQTARIDREAARYLRKQYEQRVGQVSARTGHIPTPSKSQTEQAKIGMGNLP